MRPLMTAALCLCLAAPAMADPVSDALQAALDAYAAGDIMAASASMATATGLLQTMKAEKLTAMLPEPPAGWTRKVDTAMTDAMGMLGGGIGTEVIYSSPEATFKITLTADNGMVEMVGAMLKDEAMMAQMGEVVEVQGRKFVVMDGALSAMLGNSLLFQAEGAGVDAMRPVLDIIDFDALAAAGS